MKTIKLFEICIMFLLAVAAVNAIKVNETALNNLLSSYSEDYDNGNFDVALSSYKYTANPNDYGMCCDGSGDVIGAESGNITFELNIIGPGTDSKYDVIAVLNVENEKLQNKHLDSNLIKNITKTGSGISKLAFDGNYYTAPDPSYNNNTLILDIKIYQNELLQYQDEFEVINNHLTKPILFDPVLSLPIKAVNNAGNSRYDLVVINLTMYFYEGGTYTIRAYLWDNKSATAYAETTVVVPGSGYEYKDLYDSLGDIGYYIGKNVSIIFNSNQFKDFDLDKEGIYLKAISVDGNIIDYNHYPNALGSGGFVWVYDLIAAYNWIYPSAKFNTSLNFTFNDAYITNYAFSTSSKDANGKIKELGAILNAIDVKNPPYTLELSLENEYGEVIEIKNKTTSFTGGIETIKFNGTNIYNSKISGPYRIGFARIAKLGNDVFYKLDAATSIDIAYINFTPPVFADLKINDTDLIGNGNDINVTIYNKAAGDAAGVTVSVFDSSADKVKEIIISSIAGNSNYKYTFKDIGLSNAFVAVDFANLIEESNESNNIAALISPNSPPVLAAIGNKAVNENELLTFTITASDPDNATLIYSATGMPSGASFNSLTRTFSWTPSFSQAGNHIVTFRASDGISTDSEAVTITVGDLNRAPAITSAPLTTATRGIQYSYTMSATDADGDALTYSVNDSKFAGTNPFTWTPNDNDYGTRAVTFSVTDGKSAPVTQDAVISLLEDSYLLRAATLDYNEKDAGRYTYINSQITINSQTNNSVGSSTLAGFAVSSNTEYAITHSASGYQPDTDYAYFDSRLPTCTSGTNCNLAGTYATSCAWENSPGNWYCSVSGGTLPKMTWFRYARTPYQMIKRVNYLMRS